MKIFNSVFNNLNKKTRGIIAIGYFDSFHKGHKKLLQELIRKSSEKKLINYVLTFDYIPQKEKNGKAILELNDKIRFIREVGADNLILCKFERSFYSLSPSEFLRLLHKNFNIHEYVITEDIKFGYEKSGNINTLKESGCDINIVKPEFINDIRVSTSYIKELITGGRIEEANKFIGRNFYINGIVKKGKQLGRVLGYPTMNIRNDRVIYPPNGVYITRTIINNNEYNSLTYVSDDIIESYLLNYYRFSYNFKIKVEFFKKVRDNIKFNNSEELIRQIHKDMLSLKKFAF
jgi:riboflavin kinase / FMN adenylyltransferase